MKKVKVFLCAIVFALCFLTINVYACENKEELVEQNYDYLIGIFPDFVIDGMSCDDVKFAVDNHFELVNTQEIYDYELGRAYDSHATPSKKVELNTYSAGGTLNLVTLSNVWFAIPVVRSYDIIALRFNGPTYSSGTSSYFQYSISNTSYRVDSNMSSNNVTSASNGVGFTYKVPADTNLNGMTFYMMTYTSGSGTIAGTYQHATSYVTKASAMNYGFAASGLGGVVYHASQTTMNKYDGMGGVSVTV